MWQELLFLAWTIKASQKNDYFELLSSFSSSFLIVVLRKTSEPKRNNDNSTHNEDLRIKSVSNPHHPPT